ncbi:MAG: acyl carrier protein [Oscillospiraceae bacterium]|nr:acyl carrier protein [Oscillospiraceae bacterium]
MFDQIKELILQYVEAKPEDVVSEARFIEDLHFNSYDFMSLLGELEETFGVTVDEQEVLEIRTVGDAVAYLEKLKK